MTTTFASPHRRSTRAQALTAGLLATTLALAGCNSVGIGISLPIGGLGSVGVSVDNSGRVGGSVGVGVGGATVGVGGTAQLPPPKAEPAASAASAPANR